MFPGASWCISFNRSALTMGPFQGLRLEPTNQWFNKRMGCVVQSPKTIMFRGSVPDMFRGGKAKRLCAFGEKVENIGQLSKTWNSENMLGYVWYIVIQCGIFSSKPQWDSGRPGPNGPKLWTCTESSIDMLRMFPIASRSCFGRKHAGWKPTEEKKRLKHQKIGFYHGFYHKKSAHPKDLGSKKSCVFPNNLLECTQCTSKTRTLGIPNCQWNEHGVMGEMFRPQTWRYMEIW